MARAAARRGQLLPRLLLVLTGTIAYLLQHSVAAVFGLAGRISAACALAALFGHTGTSICEPERKVETDNRVSRD